MKRESRGTASFTLIEVTLGLTILILIFGVIFQLVQFSVMGANAAADALSALGNLGYGAGDAAQAVSTVSSEMPEADAAALIRAALKVLAPK